MFDRFSDCARKCMGMSHHAALALGHEVIATDHILLGLIETKGPHHALVESACGLGTVELRSLALEAIEARRPPTGRVITGQVPFTPCAKRTLERAVAEAERVGSPEVRSEDLLVAVAADPDGAGGALLRARGFGPDARPAASPPGDVAAQLFELSLACRDLQRAQARQEQLVIGLHRAVARLLVAGAFGLIGIGGLVIAALVSHAR